MFSLLCALCVLCVLCVKYFSRQTLTQRTQRYAEIAEKIEACETRQELKDYIDTRRGVLESALGRRGEVFWKKSKELLG